MICQQNLHLCQLSEIKDTDSTGVDNGDQAQIVRDRLDAQLFSNWDCNYSIVERQTLY